MAADGAFSILLVDDQPAKLLSYEVILAELGETLLKAGSAAEALEHLLRHEVAVVLIDVCMPDLDGFELARMIRNHPRFQRTAIIFVSAIAMTDLDRVRGFEAGAVDYVPVPVVPELLRARVRVFADLYRKTRQLEAMNDELERRVAERTAALAAANAELERRVEARTREHEQALAQVHEMQKQESLGQLTGGVAHDFNNLLTIILGNLALLRKRVAAEPRLTTLIDGAIQGAERGATLTRRMLAFARRQELRPQSVSLAALVGGMAEMFSRTLGPHIEVATTLPAELPPVQVDPNQLELALLNLAVNARDAMPEGGRLLVAAELGPPPPGLAAGAYVCLSVADTGLGMDAATLRRAPEPFFTTKGAGKGTGLGLSMVHGLAAQSGGSMQIASTPGRGTTVTLWLPVATPAAEEAPPAVPTDLAALARPVPGRLRVLVVDDDPLVLASTAAMLEDVGHAVIDAPSAARALDLLRQGVVDVVVTDQAMPGMTGIELAARIRLDWPTLPVILASGYAELPDLTETALPRLRKPYLQAELLAAVEQGRSGPPGNAVVLETVGQA